MSGKTTFQTAKGKSHPFGDETSGGHQVRPRSEEAGQIKQKEA